MLLFTDHTYRLETQFFGTSYPVYGRIHTVSDKCLPQCTGQSDFTGMVAQLEESLEFKKVRWTPGDDFTTVDIQNWMPQVLAQGYQLRLVNTGDYQVATYTYTR